MSIVELTDYLNDRYDKSELLELIAEELSMEDIINIIHDYRLSYIFEEELEGETRQLEFNF